MIASAKSFLIDCLPCDTKGLSTFDKVRYSECHTSKIVGLSNFIYTLYSLRSHKKGAYLKLILTHAATLPERIFDETLHGHVRDYNSQFLRIWSHLLKKSLMENFIFCGVTMMP